MNLKDCFDARGGTPQPVRKRAIYFYFIFPFQLFSSRAGGAIVNSSVHRTSLERGCTWNRYDTIPKQCCNCCVNVRCRAWRRCKSTAPRRWATSRRTTTCSRATNTCSTPTATCWCARTSTAGSSRAAKKPNWPTDGPGKHGSAGIPGRFFCPQKYYKRYKLFI